MGDQGPPLSGLAPAAPKERWLVSRLELVSVWKSETPAVYASGSLPRMQELKTAKTRPLTDFEAKALKALREGEEVVTEATPNEIRMVGAVRAAKQCTACHEVKRGTLLGAFSYDLRRDPPVRVK
jgi:mono/diheme cytochrome c family protein